MTIEEKKNKLITDLVQARASVMQVANLVPAERAGEIFLGTWSLSDLLAHLEGWDYTNLEAVQGILLGKPPEFFQHYDKDWQSYNQHLVEHYKRQTLEQLLEEVGDSHRLLITYLESLPARDIIEGKVKRESGRSVTIRNLLQAEARDEMVHAQQILSFFSVE